MLPRTDGSNITPSEHVAAKREYLAAIKLDSGCTRCGVRDLPSCCFDFHHRDPSTKTIPMHRLPFDAGWPRILNELKKCDVLCANCHRIVEFERRRA